MNSNIVRGLVAVGVLAVSGAASAAALDVSDVATKISETVTPIGTIGSGILLIMVAIKVFSWVRSMFR
jgi:uncharacterized protein YcfJ